MGEVQGRTVSWQRVGLLTGLMVAIAAVVIVVAAIAGGGGSSSTPIEEQSCSQLVATMHQIQADEAPDQSFDTQSAASERAVRLNDRVDALGGCPDEPDLQ